MPLIPLHDRLVIKPIILEAYGTTKGGIILNSEPITSDRAEVISVGKVVKDITAGDIIVYDKTQVLKLKVDDEEIYLTRESTIFGKVKDASTN